MMNVSQIERSALNVALETKNIGALRRMFLDSGLLAMYREMMKDDSIEIAAVPAAAVVHWLNASCVPAVDAAPVEPKTAPAVTETTAPTAPAVADELPQLADEAYAAPKPVSAAAAKAKASLDAVSASLAGLCVVAPRVAAPVVRPAPAPQPERQPGAGECWCTGCAGKRHIVAVAKAFVPEQRELYVRFDGRVPSHDELVAIARCGAVTRERTPHAWHRLEDVEAEIRTLVGRKVDQRVRQVETVVGGKLGRLLGKAERQAVFHPVAQTASTPAKPKPVQEPARADKRGEKVLTSWEALRGQILGGKK